MMNLSKGTESKNDIVSLEPYRDLDPLDWTLFNPAQIRAIKALKTDGLVILAIIMGNGSGKTYGLVAIISAIIFGTANPLFSEIPLINKWNREKSMRLCAPTTALEDNGPIQKSMGALFPVGRYTQHRGMGKGYFSRGDTDNGWDWDVMSYNQAPREAAGHTKGLVVFSEPPPRDFFNEVISRTRGQGLIIIECTPLNYAAWIKEDYIDPGYLMLDGKRVGRVKMVKGTIWDNCKDLHEGGQLNTEQVQTQIALWPPEEREARTDGAFLHLAGRIYTRWGDANELEELPEYHKDCWRKGKYNFVQVQDPHDRKPWAIAWFAVFPNDDVIAITEWPPFSFKDTVTSPVFDPEEYRDIMQTAEEEIGRTPDTLLMDPNFGHAPKLMSGKSLQEIFSGPCRRCEGNSCQHSRDYEDPGDSLPEGHMYVRRAIGEPDKGMRPKIYALKDCLNFIYGMRHYGYSPTRAGKGPSETPELIHKDFPDLIRYLYLSPYCEYQQPSKPVVWEKQRWGRRRANLT